MMRKNFMHQHLHIFVMRLSVRSFVQKRNITISSNDRDFG